MAQKLNFMIFIAVMLLITSAGCYYIGRRLIWSIPFLQNKVIYVYLTLGFFVILQALGPFLYRISPESTGRPFILQWLTYVSLGFLASLLFYFLAAELLTWLASKISYFNNGNFPWDFVERRLFLGVGLFSLTTAIIGTYTALAGPELERVDVPIKNLPLEFSDFRIAQISDLHVGPTINRAYAQRVVDLTMAQNPDAIVLTGDLVDGFPEALRPQLEPLNGLQAPHGVFYITGNHEYYWGGEQWCKEFQDMGFTVLVNEQRLIKKGPTQISIGGIPDIKAGQFVPGHKADAVRAFKDVPAETIKILLAHHPAAYTQALEAGVHLQLSGHTHAGQFFPWNLFVALTHKFSRGLYAFNGLWVYTNRGTGYWGPPQRFAVPSEITLIRLVRGA